jgi:hypothetical protein
LLGIPLPFHRNFEEVNLRFYVRSGEKRGVVFVQELVPKRAVAFLANALYNEHYRVARMSHAIENGAFRALLSFYGMDRSSSSSRSITGAMRRSPMATRWNTPSSTRHGWSGLRATTISTSTSARSTAPSLSARFRRRAHAALALIPRALNAPSSRAAREQPIIWETENGAFRSSYCMHGDMAQSVTRVNPLETVFTAEGHHGLTWP